MRIIAFLFGVVLLAPGVCAFGFMAAGITALPPLGSAEWRDFDIWGMIGVAAVGWGFCYLISFGGVMMIRAAVKPPAPDSPPGSDPGDEPPASA